MKFFECNKGGRGPEPEAHLRLIKGGTLYIGDRSHPAPDGYPVDVDFSTGYSRR